MVGSFEYGKILQVPYEAGNYLAIFVNISMRKTLLCEFSGEHEVIL
jgi:hypothetical protein